MTNTLQESFARKSWPRDLQPHKPPVGCGRVHCILHRHSLGGVGPAPVGVRSARPKNRGVAEPKQIPSRLHLIDNIRCALLAVEGQGQPTVRHLHLRQTIRGRNGGIHAQGVLHQIGDAVAGIGVGIRRRPAVVRGAEVLRPPAVGRGDRRYRVRDRVVDGVGIPSPTDREGGLQSGRCVRGHRHISGDHRITGTSRQGVAAGAGKAVRVGG